MRPLSILLVLLSSCVSLSACAALDNTSTIYVAPPTGQSCPVGFSVKRAPNSGLVLVRSTRTPLSQGLHLDFNPGHTPITRAFVTVHGMNPSAHVLPTLSRLPSGAEAVETFVVSPGSGQSAIWTEKMSAITWVELTRLEYADGTTWQASPNSRCSAAPSLLVLVDAEAAPSQR